MLKTADGGATWTLAYNDSLTPLAGASALAAAGSTVYAGLNVLQSGSLVRSDDGGGTWSNLSSELPIHGSGSGGVVANLVLDPSQPDSVYTSMWDTGSPQRTGVFVSADRGQTWTEIGHLAAQVAGPGGLALDAAARRLYAATGTGVYAWDVPA